MVAMTVAVPVVVVVHGELVAFPMSIVITVVKLNAQNSGKVVHTRTVPTT